MNLLNIKTVFFFFVLTLSTVFAQNRIISGTTGTGGVLLSWVNSGAKTTTSNATTGAYTITIPNEWSGTVTPSKTGYTFAPVNKAYTNVIANQVTNYVATQITYTITGNTGTGGVLLSWVNSGAKTTTSNATTGAYTITIPHRWTGTVTPSKTGYTFAPVNKAYTNVIANQVTNYVATQITYTITGNTGTGGVLLSWVNSGAKTTTSNATTGAYTITIPHGWTGTVTPSKTGYIFAPVNKAYTNVIANQVTNYVATQITYTITGNTGTGGVLLSWVNSGPKTVTSNASGAYTITIPHGWTGTVTPSKTGYTFNPINKPYNNVIANKVNQNYIATQKQYTIKGTTGTGGVLLSWVNSGPKTVTSNASGTYTITIPHGWSGTVTPSKTGYTFNPVNRSYTNITSNKANRNYVATLKQYTIKGTTGTGGVLLSWVNSGAKTTTSNATTGAYTITIPHGWTGTVTPSKTGYTFNPVNKPYNNVIANKVNQNYVAALKQYTIKGNTGTGGVLLSWVNSGAKTITSHATTGAYTITIPHGWTGTVTPSKTGYTFVPIKRSYTSVSANKVNQNYVATLKPYTIKGTTGTGGVKLTWVNGGIKTTTSNATTGAYTITIAHGWTGIVTPSKTGYSFVPTKRSYTSVTANKINQNYAATLKQYTIMAISKPVAGGNITGLKPNGKYNHGQQVSLLAKPKTGYNFKNWTSGNNIVGNNSAITFTATKDSSLTANFKIKKYTVTYDVNPDESGTVTGLGTDGKYNHGTTVNLNAIPTNGFEFVNWKVKESGIVISTNEDLSFTITSDTNLVANFKLKTYTLTLITNPTDAGTVSGAGTYSHGETVQISATPNQGWFFANWTEVIGSDSTVDPEVLITHTFLIKNNRYFIANFSHEIYSINVTSNPIEGGSISGSGSFFFGQTAILKALPNAGWEFDKWTKNGSDVSTNSEYSFEVSGNANYVCHFKRADFIINCSSEPLNAGFTSGCGFARYLDEITVKAEANSNWGFRYWKENGDSVSADAEYTFTVSENRSIVAFFSLINGVENLNGNNIIPDNYFLSNAYPNPFNPETSFQFGLPEESYVTLMIYNIAGQVVETVLNNSLVQAGNYVNHFYASDYPSGIYIYLINANSTISEKNFKKSGKLLLLK